MMVARKCATLSTCIYHTTLQFKCRFPQSILYVLKSNDHAAPAFFPSRVLNRCCSAKLVVILKAIGSSHRRLLLVQPVEMQVTENRLQWTILEQMLMYCDQRVCGLAALRERLLTCHCPAWMVYGGHREEVLARSWHCLPLEPGSGALLVLLGP